MKKRYLILLLIPIIICIFILYRNNKSNVRLNVSDSNTFRVSAYNIGNFSLGKSGMPHGGYDLSKEKVYVTFDNLNNVIKYLRSDIYLFSEWDTNFEFCYSRSESDCNKEGITCYPRCDDKTVFKDGNNAIDKFKKGYLSNYKFTSVYPANNSEASQYSGQLLASKYSIKKEKVIYYKDIVNNYSGSKTRTMVDALVNINGKDIHFISTHLTPNDVNLRNLEYQAIKDYVKNIEYFVIGGDFNIATGSNQRWQDTINEINYLYNNVGYSAQGTESFGDFVFQAQDATLNEQLFNGRHLFDTYGNKKPYDTIVISKNLCFVNIGIGGNKEASDHLPIFADIGFKNNYKSVSKYGVCDTSEVIIKPTSTPTPTPTNTPINTETPTPTPTNTPINTETPTPTPKVEIKDDNPDNDTQKEMEPTITPEELPKTEDVIKPIPNKDEDLDVEKKDDNDNQDYSTSKSNNLSETIKEKTTNLIKTIEDFLKKNSFIVIIIIIIIVILLLI